MVVTTMETFYLINFMYFIEITLCADLDSNLQLVHILFRHGDRTTIPDTLYPKDPYINETYYPYGLGGVTNKGKQRAFNLGKTLRKRYDKFLGKMYTPDKIEAWSSDSSRTKISLLLVLAGLFPPVDEHIWESSIRWQPIPFNTLPRNNDTLFSGILCPGFQTHLSAILDSPKAKQEFKQHEELFRYISENSGLDPKTYWDIFLLYMCLKTEKEYGLILPEWTKKIYPQPLEELSIRNYDFYTATTEMRRYTSGALLKKIINDSGKPYKNRKIYLYSGHELNIAYLLRTMEVFEPHIPQYGSYVSFELHKINNVYGFKIYYENYTSSEPRLLKLPACDNFCPLDEFISLLEEYIPANESC